MRRSIARLITNPGSRATHFCMLVTAMGSSKLRKTEHSGPKCGQGALWGTKERAKRKSKKIRRERWKAEIREGSAETR